MERPKFAVGEIVQYVGPDPADHGKCFEVLEVRHSGQGEFVDHFEQGGYNGYRYRCDSKGLGSWAREYNLRKRPDTREPFSIEALKEKYQPEPA